jgi:hypothetical protein
MSSEGPPMPDGAPDSPNMALATDLIAIRNSLNTPETVGRALANYVLTEAVTQGTQVDADTFEMPLTVTTTVVRSKSEDVTTVICSHHSLTIGGHELIGWHSCHTETHPIS